jgi:hypothetical protein
VKGAGPGGNPGQADAQRPSGNVVASSVGPRATVRRGKVTRRILETALYGPTREQRWAEQDAQAEAEFAAFDRREAEAAAGGGLTDAEYEALFGPDN